MRVAPRIRSRRAHAPRAHAPSTRIIAALTTVVLAANLTVLAGGWATSPSSATTAPDGSLARAAVALAASPPGQEPAVIETDLDPLEGVVVEIPQATEPVEGAVALPTPEPPPTDVYAATPLVRHGQLEIPAIGLSQPLFEGVTLTAINRGPSHWPGTAMPGEIGNVVIAGHRTTYTRPFWALNELVPGDELIFTVEGERIVYELERTEIVSPTDVHIIDQTAERRATLFACHPRGSARQRIVGHFRVKPPSVTVEFFDSTGMGRSMGDL